MVDELRTPLNLASLEGQAVLETVNRAQVVAPSWQVRPPDQETAERFAELLRDDPSALPPPDYVLDPRPPTKGFPMMLIGTGYVRSVAQFGVLKQPSILARVWRAPGDPEELAFLLALREDALGPRPMHSRDRARNAVHLHELFPTWSNRQIGREVGLSHTKIDQLAHDEWQILPSERSEQTFDPEQVSRRAVRALLELEQRVGRRNAGAWLGRAIWDLTSEGEELAVVRSFTAAIQRAAGYVEKEASDP